MRSDVCAFVLMIAACSHTRQHVGSTMLDMQPTRPTFAGQLDFDLLERVRGMACAKSDDSFRSGPSVVYWMGEPSMPEVEPAVRGIVAAAALDALERTGADTLMITRIITEAKNDEELCAYVYARAVKLKKAEPSIKPEVQPEAPVAPERDQATGE
jgi:hypothetical protein